MKLFLKDVNALIDAMGGKELYGLMPEEKYTVTEWKFPVLLEVDEKKKTFKLVEENAKEPQLEVKEQPKETKKKKDWVKIGFYIAFGVVAAVIVGIAIFKLV